MKNLILILSIIILTIAFMVMLCSCSYQRPEQTPEEALNQKVMDHTINQINEFNRMNNSLMQNHNIR